MEETFLSLSRTSSLLTSAFAQLSESLSNLTWQVKRFANTQENGVDDDATFRIQKTAVQHRDYERLGSAQLLQNDPTKNWDPP
ncbi:hypothetical protein V6N13_090476 [Hibiscus sabdariffa]|uniref:Uncharacterized protein n=2 Tax=Hibiscus sabdariffa TaxID=183260 RepID=A0ABR2C076_9ROSI